MILKAKAAGAESLFGMPTQPDGVAMFKQMVELGWTPKFSLIIRAPENVKWGETLGKTGDYVTIFPGWHNAMKFPGVDELNAKYQAEFSRPADLLTGPAYACVQLLANAIEKAGTLDRDKIRDAMAASDMDDGDRPGHFPPGRHRRGGRIRSSSGRTASWSWCGRLSTPRPSWPIRPRHSSSGKSRLIQGGRRQV